MNIDDLTLKQIREINKLNLDQPAVVADFQPFEIGKAYLIRTVTMIDIGIVKAVGDGELVLSNASWIADTGRFHDALKDGAEKLAEVEPFTGDVIIGRGAIIDAVEWSHPLPSEQK
jgi:hypothetical protein